MQRMLDAVSPGDMILLIEDGVYHSVAANLDTLTSRHPQLSLYALESDVQARGVGNFLDQSIEIINYNLFVQLSCKADRVVSWF